MADEAAQTGDTGGNPPAGGNAPPSGTGASNAAADWTSGLPDDLKGVAAAKGWRDPAQAVQSYQGLEKLLGADRAGRTVVMPKDDAPDAEKAAFFQSLGRPEAPDGYGLSTREGADPAFSAEAAKAMFEAGLSKAQAAKLADWFDGQGGGAQEAANADFARRSEAEVNELRAAWGKDADARVETARRYARQAGFDEAELDKIERAIGSRAMLERFDAAGRGLMEDTQPGGGRGFDGNLTPEGARAQLRAMMGDEASVKALTNKKHPGHGDAVAKKARLEAASVNRA